MEFPPGLEGFPSRGAPLGSMITVMGMNPVYQRLPGFNFEGAGARGQATQPLRSICATTSG